MDLCITKKICTSCQKLLKVATKPVLVVCLYAAIPKLHFFGSGIFPKRILGRHMDLPVRNRYAVVA